MSRPAKYAKLADKDDSRSDMHSHQQQQRGSDRAAGTSSPPVVANSGSAIAQSPRLAPGSPPRHHSHAFRQNRSSGGLGSHPPLMSRLSSHFKESLSAMLLPNADSSVLASAPSGVPIDMPHLAMHPDDAHELRAITTMPTAVAGGPGSPLAASLQDISSSGGLGGLAFKMTVKSSAELLAAGSSTSSLNLRPSGGSSDADSPIVRRNGSNASKHSGVKKKLARGASKLRSSMHSSSSVSSKGSVEDSSTTISGPSEVGHHATAEKQGWRAKLNDINPGLPLMLINSLVGCFISLCVKTLSSAPYNYGAFEIVFARSLTLGVVGIIWQICAPWLHFSGAGTVPSWLDLCIGKKGYRGAMLGRSVCGFMSVSLYYMSIRNLSMAEATVLSFTTPIWVGIMARIVLKEKWEAIDAAASVTSLLGVAVIANPSFLDAFSQAAGDMGTAAAVQTALQPSLATPQERFLSIVFGLCSSLCGAGVYIFLRGLKGAMPAIQVSSCFALLSAVFAPAGAWIYNGSPLAVAARVPASVGEFMLLIPLVSFLGLSNQLLLNTALRFETAAKCSVMNFTQVPFSFLVEFLVRGRIPGLSDCIGGGVIVGCVLFVSITKLQKEMKERHAKAAAANPSAKQMMASAKQTVVSAGRRYEKLAQ
ncbi:hypothetical protein BC828DRAFT_364590 [Blastocladiella britannica]|nr:hypothetical protein BC828DRAFT_364590 [Blastocladiella britannica]